MNKSKFKKLQELCHKIAVEKGFWEIQKSTDKFGGGYFRNDGELIALMHSELSEALEDLRQGNDNHVGSELADCVIRIMDYCEAREINLETEILKKIEVNKKRKYRHGKKF